MTRYLKTTLVAAAALLAASCIRNDIPYPLVEISIAGVEGEGFALKEIDGAQRTVTLAVDERTDLRQVPISRVDYDVTVHSVSLDKAALIGQIRSSQPLTGTFDLRTPIYTTLSLYQDYDWTIRAEQTIERRFAVAGQVGKTLFDRENRIATANVASDADLGSVTVTDLKLGPEGITTYSPTLEELTGTSFETVRFVDVTAHGRTERWMLSVKHTDKTVRLTRADAWSRVVWLYGEGIEGTEMGFRYRVEGAAEWTDVRPAVAGGSFTASFEAQPQTTYELMAYCGAEQSDAVTVTTDPEAPLPNGGFEEWCTLKDIVYPYAEGSPYWGTGNPGAKIGSETLTQPADPRPGSAGKYAAHLKSKKVTVFGIGKFAAGNLFTGNYVRTEVTNGVLSFGRAFKLRPTGLKIRVKYIRGIIDEVNKIPAGSDLKKGDPDNGIVYIALGTWKSEEYGKDSKGGQVGTADSPICIDTRDVTTFFKPNGKDVVGYGEYVMTESVDDWTEVIIPIRYEATDIVPTTMLIVCSASRWGDYFTGSTKSEMWLDDFELIYTPLEK